MGLPRGSEAVAVARWAGSGVEGEDVEGAECSGGRCRDPRYSDSLEYLYGAGRADPPEGVFVDVAVSGYGSCGVRDSGELECWGEHSGAVPEGRFAKVLGSGLHGCAVAVDGSVVCWGDNEFGQLDAPEGVFVEVSVSGSRSCAVAVEGSVRCWGADADLAVPAGDFEKVYAHGYAFGLCGLRTDGEYVCWGQDGRYGTLSDAPEGKFEALALELGQACALRTDGAVLCWGSDAAAGDGRFAAPLVHRTNARGDRFLGSADGPYAALSLGYGHGCALAVDGSVQCWGDNNSGQAEPQQGPFVEVTAGGDFTCGLGAAGEVSCWGHGSAHREARASALSRISAGQSFLCGVLASDATVSCWPQYTGGGPFLKAERLKDEPKGGDYVDVDAGRDFACALRADGQAVCWGYRDDLWEVFAFASEQRYGAIAVGYDAACGLRTDGIGHCWIPNWHPPGPGGQFAHIAAGPCGIRPTGDIECWGFTKHRGEPPDSIGPLTDAATGWRISCGIQATNSDIACWDPETNHQRFTIEGSYSQVSTAGSRICALTTNRALRCWRFRPGGPALHSCQPGDCWNRQGEQSFDMPEGTFTKIAIGGEHACAIRTDGTIACWGSNYYNSQWLPRVDEPQESNAWTARWRPWPVLAVAALLAAVAVVAAELLKVRRRRSALSDPRESVTVADPETTKRTLHGLIRSDHPDRPDTSK